MPIVRWTGRGRFSYSDWIIQSGETVEVSEDDADELLNHRTGEWERVDESDDSDEEGDEADFDEAMEESRAVVEDATDSEAEYETYPREELEETDWSDLRTLASESDHPEISGRSSRQDIVDALSED